MATTKKPGRPKGTKTGRAPRARPQPPTLPQAGQAPGYATWQVSVYDMAASWIDQPLKEMVSRMKFTPEMQKQLCINYAQHGNLSRACCEIGVNRATVMMHLEDDNPIFAANFEMAKDLFTARLEDAALFRAVVGEEQPIVQKGVIVGYKRVTSDALLILMLKSNAPHKYGDKVKLEATTGGVLVLPITAPASQDEWLSQNEDKKLPPAIDVHSTEKET